jgi:hypothetical protein
MNPPQVIIAGSHITQMEFLAPIYEGKLWHNFILRNAGAKKTSIQSITDFILKTFEGINVLYKKRCVVKIVVDANVIIF